MSHYCSPMKPTNMDPAKDRLTRMSLHPLTLEEALRQITAHKIEPKPQKGGRKKQEKPQPEAQA